MALMIGCIWHGLDALQGTRAKPGNHLVVYNGTIFCFVYSVHIIYKFRTCLRASSCNFVVDG